MNKKLAECIIEELAEKHPAIHAEIEEMNAIHPSPWYQVWLWSEQTKQTPICIQTEYDWGRFHIYRSLFAEVGVQQ